MRARGSQARLVATNHRADVEQWTASRRLYLDNLKVILIAAIIAAHALTSYASEAWWLYSDVRETSLSAVTEGVFMVLAGPLGLVMIPLLFLIAGLLTPHSLERKGAGPYVRDRMLRLGVPFAAFLLLWPLVEYILFESFGAHPGSYWQRLSDSEEPLQTGAVWFVGTLLVFSLVYAAWMALRPGRPSPSWRADPGVGHLLALAAAVGVATFLVRLDVPFDSDKYVALNLYQWPECAAAFALGIALAPRGWLVAVPDRLWRHCRTATLAAVAAFGLYGVVGMLLGLGGPDEARWDGGWHLDAFVFAMLLSVVTVAGPVWVLAAAQRHLERPLRWVGPAVMRSAYGAFMVQPVLLVGVAVVMRPLAAPAEVKAVVLAVASVLGSYGLAWLLISRVPGVRRVL